MTTDLIPDDTRPAWKHEIPEETVRWFYSGGFITKITHHWKMMGADTSEDWIVLHKQSSMDGGKMVERKFPSSWLNTNGYFEFKPNWRELVVPTYRGRDAIKDIETIDVWEKKNQRERAEFERLKRKFKTP